MCFVTHPLTSCCVGLDKERLIQFLVLTEEKRGRKGGKNTQEPNRESSGGRKQRGKRPCYIQLLVTHSLEPLTQTASSLIHGKQTHFQLSDGFYWLLGQQYN